MLFCGQRSDQNIKYGRKFYLQSPKQFHIKMGFCLFTVEITTKKKPSMKVQQMKRTLMIKKKKIIQVYLSSDGLLRD